MTKKKLIALFSILFVIVLIIVTMTTFTLHSVSIFFVAQTTESFNSQQMIKDGEFLIGRSLFLQKKEDSIKKIEKKNPYAKVLKIETKFPNKFVVHVAERQPLYAIEKNGEYAILDEEFKVLDRMFEEDFEEYEVSPIVIRCDNYTVLFEHFERGDFVEISSANEIFGTLCTSLKSYDYDLIAMKNMIKNIDYNMLNNQLHIFTYYGIELILDKTDYMLDRKISIAFDGYEKYKQESNANTIIAVSDDGEQVTYTVRTR